MQTKFFGLVKLFAILVHSQIPAATNGATDASTAAQHRIVNGREARIEDFPYQLSLRRQAIHICGASVLDSTWAITAAHCFDGFEKLPSIYTLRIGSSQRLYGGIVTVVSNIYRHPTYDSDTMNFDVALLRTQPNKLRGDFVAPIPLPATFDWIADGTEATVSGWGHMSSDEHVLSSVLKFVSVYTVNQRKCNEDMKSQGGITDAMFCAAGRRRDACQGDSGGPIQIDGILVGIVSWGVGCADPRYPGVYTRLGYPPIRQWIRLLAKL